MKKIFLGFIAFLFISATALAQQPSSNKKKATAPTTTTVKLKKDGTPDKRYKNPVGPTKKDGTLDKRYKVNKKK